MYLDDDVSESEVEWHQSACVLCSNGCGMDIAVQGGQMVGVRGRAQDRINHGRLGPKGLFGWQANRLSPDEVVPVAQAACPDAAMVMVFQSSRRRRDLSTAVPVHRLEGAHPGHWWLVVQR